MYCSPLYHPHPHPLPPTEEGIRPSSLTKALRSTFGVVYVEFLISFIPVFVLFLAVAQLSFIAVAKLVVRHAAIAGVRSAIVVLEDRKELYGGEPYGLIDEQGSGGSPRGEQTAKRMAAWFGGGQTPPGFSLNKRGGPRLSDIRRAVYFPLLAIAPPPEQIAGWFGVSLGAAGPGYGSEPSLAGAIGNTPALRFVSGLAYNRAATAVSFPRRPGSDELIQGRVKARDDVTVRVTYLYPCSVPIVSLFMCETIFGQSGIPAFMRAAADKLASPDPREIARWRHDIRRLRADTKEFKRTLSELSHVEQPEMLVPLAAGGVRFAILRAEATLPNQGADYYRDREDAQKN